MNALKISSVAAIVAGLCTMSAQVADAQVQFFSRSGKDSVFAAGVHGYGKYEPALRVDASLQDRSVSPADRHALDPAEGRVWRETSYYEFHPRTVIRHGDHYKVIPGHYEYRSTGYWD